MNPTEKPIHDREETQPVSNGETQEIKQETRRLYKSRQHRIIDGVCGGFGEYFNADPTIVRILWVLLTLASFGAGIVLYLACMIIVPVNPYQTSFSQPASSSSAGNGARSFWGALLIIVGGVVLLSKFGFEFFHFWHIPWGFVFPVIIILLGVFLILQSRGKAAETPSASTEASETTGQERPKELRRSVVDRKIFGVCGGLAKYLGADSSIIRILFIVLTLASFGMGVILYLALAIIVPEERASPTPQP
jgi:phage shock protein C